jgi:ATP-dependent helicase/nuclease subunit B
LLLTRLVLAVGEAHGGGPASPAQAVRLADELARLLDQFQTERLAFDRLADLVPEEFAAHWQITLRFLRIVTEQWPGILAEEGGIDPADRRNRLAAAQIETWRRSPPGGLVVAAGSTGTVPATADLIAAVAELENGLVVLPGLDSTLDDATRGGIGPTHPQYGMLRLLERLGVAPVDVAPWPGAGDAAAGEERARLLAAVMHPAAFDPLRLDNVTLVRALGGVRRIDCRGPREEATVIALMMREALETPQKTAALVTSDRTLARRVAAELRRWNVEVDDSAGNPLDRTPSGSYLRLTAGLVAEQFAPVPLLATLKHPLAAAGLATSALRHAVRRLELLALRGPRPGPGVAGLRAALDSDAPAEVQALIDRLEGLSAPFARLFAQRSADVADLLAAHVAFAESLAATDVSDGASRLWAHDDGEALAEFVADFATAAPAIAPITAAAWPALLETLMHGRVVRPRYGRHPRLHVWGQLEARLQRADLVVLAGLNEGTWPAEPDIDPWLSRPMRAGLGLPSPERRIGLAAHDFAQAFAAKEVVLTRSTRVDGTPTVPCRWLLRLDNVIRACVGPDPREDDRPAWPAWRNDQAKWRAWQRSLDESIDPIQIKAPAPCPPVSARPRQLSATQIEALVRDPYSVYARHILKLKALDPIDADPGAMERGTLIHRALDEFLKSCPGALPPDALERLLAIGRRAFDSTLTRPGVAAFWWPRFQRIAAWFVATERERRGLATAVLAEVRGKMQIEAPAGPFTVTAIADRIERRVTGGLAIVDYKTGKPPGKGDVASGFAPQLPLEGLIAESGGFAGLDRRRVEALEFWRLSGGVPPGEVCPAADDGAALLDAARSGLAALVAAYDDPETPYIARPFGERAARTPDYDHLARVAEWLARGREDEG